MMITQITPQKRKGRFNLFVDDEFITGLHEEIFLKFNLHEDDEIDDTTIASIIQKEKILSAKDKALRLLTYRPRSVDELRHKLIQAGYKENIYDQVIQDLIRVGLLNDVSFAESFARTKIIQRPLGKRLMIQELKSKGIHAEIIQKTVDLVYSEYSDLELARQLVRKKLTHINLDEDPKLKKRLIDLLKRRGFDWDIIEQALSNTMEEN